MNPASDFLTYKYNVVEISSDDGTATVIILNPNKTGTYNQSTPEETTTKKQEQTTKAPETTTKKQEQTTKAPETTTQKPSQYPTWDASTIYLGNDYVSYNGHVYRAKWWTKGENPEKSGQWDVWQKIK